MPAPTPPVVPKAFGADASDPDFINLIPETTVDPGRASLSLGFPPQTMTPEIAGGTPPFGQDVNGILFMLSSHTVYAQSGQPYLYNSTLATAIGGYAVGTILGMSDGSGLWINRTAANMTDPDDAGAAGWVPAYSYGSATVPVTGGVVTLTPTQAKKKIVILQGVLGSNLQVIVPTRIDDWLIVNQTSGAFSTVVKTALGTGVTVPPGGSSAPTGVYCDGTSVFSIVAPVNLPIDQNPTGLTIVQRTSAGYATATYFNSNNSIENGNPISAVFYETGNDGYHRKMSPATFAANLALSWLSGQVTNGQVPFSAVLQYAAALFTSPAFTGIPTAPTAPPGTATTQIATTAFAAALASVGYNQNWSGNLYGVTRIIGTSYVNGTGRPIMVTVYGGGAAGASIGLAVQGQLVTLASWIGAAASFNQNICAIVPPGATYSLNVVGSVSITGWHELS
jgi:hypothetical protein